MKASICFGFFLLILACIVESLHANITITTRNTESITIIPTTKKTTFNKSRESTADFARYIAYIGSPRDKQHSFDSFLERNRQATLRKKEQLANRTSITNGSVSIPASNDSYENNSLHPDFVYGKPHDKPWHDPEPYWSKANFSFIPTRHFFYPGQNSWIQSKIKVNNTTPAPPPRRYEPYYYATFINPGYKKSILFGLNTFLTFFGIFLNIVFISIHFHEPQLNNFGSTFIANIGVTNVMVSCGVPGYAWTLLAAQAEPSVYNCRVMWSIVMTAINVHFLSHMMAALELYVRMEYNTFTLSTKWKKWLGGTILVVIWSMSIFSVKVGTDYKLDYDICERKSEGNVIFRTSSYVTFFAVPFIIIGVIYFKIYLKYCNSRKEAFYRRAFEFQDQLKLAFAHFMHFISILLFWIGYVICVILNPEIADSIFFSCAWIGMLYFIFGHLTYIFTNKYYRRAYIASIKYCLLKKSIGGFEANRRIMDAYDQNPMGEVRVHVLQNASNPSSPHNRVRYNRDRDSAEII